MPLQIIRQDIVNMRVDAIVNTTNEEMVGYSGVDLAVHAAAGPGLDAECQRLAPLGLGQAVITGAYGLPCKYVIHTSGPVWQGGLAGESVLLRSCYLESLRLAVKHRCCSVAVPLISAGNYGYPKDQVLRFAVRTITEFLFEHELTVYLCVFDRESYTFSQTLFHDIRAYIDDAYAEERDGDLYDRMDKRSRYAGRVASVAPVRTKALEPTIFKGSSLNRETLHEYVKRRDKGFRELLFEHIEASGMSDVECYKKANVDKRTFSKIKSNRDYRPSRQTAIAFAISLELDLAGTQELLATLGFTLSNSTVFDKIIRYFIQKENYNIFDINEALFEFDQVLLGSL